MGNSRRDKERRPRKEGIRNLKFGNWLIVCEGEKTEPNYFEEAIKEINEKQDKDHKFNVRVEGKGMNTISLVKSADELQNIIDKYSRKTIKYEKTFVVFDKDSFTATAFNNAAKMCERRGYIALWSNEAIEYWFLLHFHCIVVDMSREDYSNKISEYFKKKGLNYEYKKNDKKIYSNLCKYGSLENARNNAKKVHKEHENDTPTKSASCTTVYRFFDEIDKKLKELE